MAAKRTISIIGPGRLGKALALSLFRGGYKIDEIVSQSHPASRRKASGVAAKVNATASDHTRARLGADVIWFCVPDRQIANVARQFADTTNWRRRTAFHSSGALTHNELRVLQRRGAKVASVHPFMTFVSAAVPSLEHVPFAIEGDRAAVRVAREVVRRLGGEPFTINPQKKVAYHTWGAFASPLLVALLVTAEQVGRLAGIRPTEARKKMLPILRQTITNYGALGPAGAFSVPLVRGDAEIVRKHLAALRRSPDSRAVYLCLARSALHYLPVKQRQALKKSLGS